LVREAAFPIANAVVNSRRLRGRIITATLLITFLGIAGVILLWVCWSLELQDVWSISIYAGTDPFSLGPHPLVGRHPLIAAADVTDVTAGFVADPFMVLHGTRWYMFFEVLDRDSRRGVIAVACSEDGYSWRYERVVLREPFHLSYPYVFEWGGVFYMIPETSQASAIRLYRAADFPGRWQLVCELIVGKYWDPSIIYKDGFWWLFALNGKASLTLHYAAGLQGPWVEHPRSPVVKESTSIARPGGRLIVHQGKIVRYAQDGERNYGAGLRAFQVDEMTTDSYREHELLESPVLVASGMGWNATGMHHADAHQISEGNWIACVDGNRQRVAFNWRAGARRILDTLGLSRRAIR
jgi:hypothetical protein